MIRAMLCIVLLTASAALGRTAVVGENSHRGFVVHDAGRWQVIADVNPGQHKGFGEGRLRQAAGCFVAPSGSGTARIHGNSLNSPKPNHVYVIVDTQTGKLVKPGVSGQSLTRSGPPDDIVKFVARYEREFNEAVAGRMQELGIPEKSIGLKGTPLDQPFESRSAIGGSHLHPDWSDVENPMIRVDIAALDARFNASSPTWAKASWKDRIDAIIAHEWFEVHNKGATVAARHNATLQHAADTTLSITKNARQILVEDKLYRPRIGE